MALEVTRKDGSTAPILSLGEFKVLLDAMDPASVSPSLTAWAEGQALTAAQLCATLDVDCRLSLMSGARGEPGSRMIDIGVARLEVACPEVAIAT